MQAELDAYLDSMKGKVRGAIVLVGKHVEVPEDMNPAAMRRSQQSAARIQFPHAAWSRRWTPHTPRSEQGH